MSCSIAARRSSSSSASSRPSPRPTVGRQRGDVVDVRVEVRLALVERLQEHLERTVDLGVVALDRVAALVRVEPLRLPRGGRQSLRSPARVAAPRRTSSSPTNPSPVLGERVERGVEQVRGALRVRRGRAGRTRLRRAGRRRPGRVFEDGCELVAEAGQQRVAGGVTEGVVVALEAVEVVDREQPGPLGRGLGDRLVEVARSAGAGCRAP